MVKQIIIYNKETEKEEACFEVPNHVIEKIKELIKQDAKRSV